MRHLIIGLLLLAPGGILAGEPSQRHPDPDR